MDLSKETLKEIIKLEKQIYNLYFKNNFMDEKVINLLIRLILLEDQMISSLHLNEFNFEEVKKFISSNVIVLPNIDLLAGTYSILNEQSYPYFRLFVRTVKSIRYQDNKEMKKNNRLLIDNEVELFYMLLANLSEKKSSIKDDLSLYMRRILIDSKTFEMQMLYNKFEPPKEITTVESPNRFQVLYPKVASRLFYEIMHETKEPLENRASFQMYLIHYKVALSHLSQELRDNIVIDYDLNGLDDANFLRESNALKRYLKEAKVEMDSFIQDKVHYLKRV